MSTTTAVASQMPIAAESSLDSDYNESYYDGELPLLPEVWLIPLAFGVICLIGIIGNGLVIYVILKNKQMRTVTNYYILNLAITDFAFLSCAVPFTSTNHVSEWVFGDFMCKFTFYLIHVTLQATCITLTAMSVDRYYAIAHPLKSLKTRTPRVALSVSAAIWICSALIAIPVALYREVQYFHWYGVRPFCISIWPTFNWMIGWSGYTIVSSYVLPIIIITVCSTMMLRRLWSQVVPGEETELHAQSLRQKKKITRMVMTVVGLFFICWLPIHAIIIWLNVPGGGFDRNNDIHFAFYIFANCLSYSNSSMNPFVYAFMGDNFRKCFKKAFPRCFKKHQSTVAVVGQAVTLGAGDTGSTGATVTRQQKTGLAVLPSQA